jgi:release factor glutamine methyltransferase
MLSSAKRVFFNRYVFRVHENVYEPAEDSFLFAEYLLREKGERVLDVGTGCGILGIVAGADAARIVGVDINPYALRCTRENAKLNGLIEKFSLVQGDLFRPLKRKAAFDLILFNSPYLPVRRTQKGSWLEHAWAGGKTGRQTINRFILESPDYLASGGRILLLQSSLCDIERTLKNFTEKALEARVVRMIDLPFFESIVLIEARRSNHSYA